MQCNKHRWIVVEWNGDIAHVLMCSHCMETVSYKEVKFAKKKYANVVYDEKQAEE